VQTANRAKVQLTLRLLEGAAAETDEDLMHEELSRYSLDLAGYSRRTLGWSEEADEAACQIFAVYGEEVWKTRGLFVTRARGRVDDSDEVLSGVCLRILGLLVDLAALIGGTGRKWTKAHMRSWIFFRERSMLRRHVFLSKPLQ
jgi:hypothetical protein